MKTILVEADQLSRRSALFKIAPANETVVLLIESTAELTRPPFHKQRLVLVLSAMRHFAGELQRAGYAVEYFRLCDEPAKAIRAALGTHGADAVALLQSASHGADQKWSAAIAEAGAKPIVLPNDMFLGARLGQDFAIPPGKPVRMEPFYRRMRKATGILMKDGGPVGGQWNFDKENRRPPSGRMDCPAIPEYPPDEVTREVIEDVQTRFPQHWGKAEPFRRPVTREDALSMLENFLEHRLPGFGSYQDAMLSGQDSLFHSLLSGCLNIGLLDPEELCARAEREYLEGRAPLNLAEGFIRQVLGWRKFVYQLYRANMPGYDTLNHLEAQLPLPSFYWNADTRMRCLAESIRPVIERAMSHHIQRLMVTGNFALLAGISPQALNEWYWLGFIDAWHWVVTPNVVGMATFADGGLMASKPYAASANYINRMSDYCASCTCNHNETTGEDACPFNPLYWDFLDRNRDRLRGDPRMSLSYRNLARKSGREMEEIRRGAEWLRSRIARDSPI